jgi:hypothetical protein
MSDRGPVPRHNGSRSFLIRWLSNLSPLSHSHHQTGSASRSISLFGSRPVIAIYGQWTRLEPQLPRFDHRINSHLKPPDRFVPAAMNLAMMATAQWHREFITYLAAQGLALRKSHMVGIRWLAAADQARLLGNVPDVIAVADSSRLGERKHALVNSSGAPLPNTPGGMVLDVSLQTPRPY